MSNPKQEVPITLDELQTLTSSAIADIHSEVDEVFADGLRRVGDDNWTADTLSTKRAELADCFDRAIELCEQLESRALVPEELVKADADADRIVIAGNLVVDGRALAEAIVKNMPRVLADASVGK